MTDEDDAPRLPPVSPARPPHEGEQARERPLPPGGTARPRGRWRRRASSDDDEGPFFPPEPAAAPSVPVSTSRPRPGPRPRPRPAAPAATTDDDGYRSPDISRYLAAEAPAPAARGDGPPKARHAKPVDPPKSKEPREPGQWRQKLRGSRGLRVVIKLAIALGVAAVAAVVLRAYVVAPYYIPSASMEPALQGGGGGSDDRILVDKVTYHIHDPHEGDIVVFNRPDTWKIADKTLVKRIIGLPGDIVTLRRGLVYVNGMRLTENYVNKACGSAPTKPLTRTSRWTVPMDDYFVMGDNRCNSDDSRMFGPIPRSKIVGRAFLIVWPLSRFGTP